MSRLQNNPSIGWVHPKSTHAHPLAWGNNNNHPVDGVAGYSILPTGKQQLI
jgi:hypothetical protein